VVLNVSPFFFANLATFSENNPNYGTCNSLTSSEGSTICQPGTVCRLLFFSAKPSDELMFDSLRREAAAKGDVVVLPSIWESYHNITYQTLEVLRFAAADRDTTHVLKVTHLVDT